MNYGREIQNNWEEGVLLVRDLFVREGLSGVVTFEQRLWDCRVSKLLPHT